MQVNTLISVCLSRDMDLSTLFIIFLVLYKSVNTNSEDDQLSKVETTDAVVGSAPYHVSLRLSNRTHYCSGSIIAERWILTTAHCLDRSIPAYIAAGSILLNLGNTRQYVQSTFRHYFYDPTTRTDDLGLIKTKKDIVFNTNMAPVDLMTEDISQDCEVMVTGWGSVNIKEGISNNLQVTNTNRFNHGLCKTIWENAPGTSKVNDGNFCICQDLSKKLCGNDLGSPVVYKNQLLGVISTAGSCTMGIPDVVTKISTSLWWINWIKNTNFD